ncbi:MAG: hypothetical protein F6J93_38295 [Oscillatoria sp. SIO1A7]|nr:hypothetical protein [Oscillatoria sp. SIO1A7]
MTISAVKRGRSYWDASPVVAHINLRNAIRLGCGGDRRRPVGQTMRLP